MEIIFEKYLTGEEVEYPLQRMPVDILPMGDYWSYVNSSFINGFLNMGKPVGFYLLSRYHKHDDLLDTQHYQPEIVKLNPPGKQFEWEEVSYSTKRELIQKFEQGYRCYHSNLSIFTDEVLVLLYVEAEQPYYIFIACDPDVSDCCIGRFNLLESNETQEQVLIDFETFANSRSQDNHQEDAIRMPKQWFSGWLSF